MDSVSFIEAVADFEAVADRVVADRAPLKIINEHGEGVVLIPAHEWSAIEEVLLFK